MKAVMILGLALAALVATASAGCQCDEDFSGFGTEPGKCGCCPWPCCCKCFEKEDCNPQTTTPFCPCLDLAFIVDASGTIGSEDWLTTLEFMAFLVENIAFFLDPITCGDQINVGMVTFGTNSSFIFDWTPSASAPIMSTPQSKGFTNIVEGMETALNELFSQERDCVPFAVILTDGRARLRASEIPSMGAALRTAVDGNLVCIGITSAISEEQLASICIDEDKQLSVLDFDDLTALAVDTVNAAVADIEITPPEPDCVTVEECFCCCSPEQFWGVGRGFYGR